MRSKTTFTFEDEATYKSFAAGARENKNFNLEILENAVIFRKYILQKLLISRGVGKFKIGKVLLILTKLLLIFSKIPCHFSKSNITVISQKAK